MFSKEVRARIIHGIGIFGLLFLNYIALDTKPTFAQTNSQQPITTPDLNNRLLLPLIISETEPTRENRSREVASTEELYQILEDWQNERNENPETHFHYEVTVTKDLSLYRSFPAQIETTELTPTTDVKSVALQLPDDIVLQGKSSTEKNIKIFILKQDIGLLAQNSQKIELRDIDIVKAQKDLAAKYSDGRKKDPSDFALVYIASQNGLVTINHVNCDDITGNFTEDFQEFSFSKVIGADTVTVTDFGHVSASWDSFSLVDIQKGNFSTLRYSRNREASLLIGAIIGFTSSLTRPTGSININGVTIDESGYKIFGEYRGQKFIPDSTGGHYDKAHQQMTTIIENVLFKKLLYPPAWYFYTGETGVPQVVTFNKISIDKDSYLQSIIEGISPDSTTQINDSDFYIRHFDQSGNFFIIGSNGSARGDVIAPTSGITVTAQNSSVTLEEVPNQASIPAGYDSYGLPTSSNVVRRLLDAGFTVNFRSNSGVVTQQTR